MVAGLGSSWTESAATLGGLGTSAGSFLAATAPWYQLALLALAAAYLLARRAAGSPRLAPCRRQMALRLMLLGISAIGAFISVDRLAAVAEQVVANPIFAPPADDVAFRDTLMASLARAATTRSFDQEIVEALERGDVDQAASLVDAAGLLSHPLRPTTRQAFEAATEWRASLWRGAREALTGAVTGDARSVASLGGAFAVDLTPLVTCAIWWSSSACASTRTGFWLVSRPWALA
jgi:hypothetical protein